jgi:hypothetical protein
VMNFLQAEAPLLDLGGLANLLGNLERLKQHDELSDPKPALDFIVALLELGYVVRDDLGLLTVSSDYLDSEG